MTVPRPPGLPPIRAGYLPGIGPDEVAWEVLPFVQGGARVEVAVPVLTAAQMEALADRVQRAAARHLKTMTVAQIIEVIDRAIARLLDLSLIHISEPTRPY